MSRNSVREALMALQAMGIVEVRHGFGTYVGAMSMAPIAEGVSFRTVAGHRRGEDSLRQLLELREAVETELMARLVPGAPERTAGTAERAEDAERNAPSTDVGGNGAPEAGGTGELEEVLVRMGEEAQDGEIRAETDRAFHSALYGELGNSLLSEVLDAFWDAFHQVRTDLAELPQDPMVTWRQHAEILVAVRAGDTGRAERAVRDHFAHIRDRLRSPAAEAPAGQAQFGDSSVTPDSAIPPQPR